MKKKGIATTPERRFAMTKGAVQTPLRYASGIVRFGLPCGSHRLTKNCIQGNLIIFTISGKCSGKDKPVKPYCQTDSEDYRKLRISEMKSEQDNLITAIVSKNLAGSSRKPLLSAGWRRILIKKAGILINILRDNITAVFCAEKRRKPLLSAGCANW